MLLLQLLLTINLLLMVLVDSDPHGDNGCYITITMMITITVMIMKHPLFINITSATKNLVVPIRSFFCQSPYPLHGFLQRLICHLNKKVLLRERKRHTDCHVASTRYAAPGGGVPWVGPST